MKMLPWSDPKIRLANLSEGFAAMALARLVRKRVAFAVRATGTDILSLDSDHLYILSTTAFGRVGLAALAGAISAATAENSVIFFDGQKVHGYQGSAAFALAGVFRNKITLAVILAVTHIVRFRFFRGDQHITGRNQKHRAYGSNHQFLHIPNSFLKLPLIILKLHLKKY